MSGGPPRARVMAPWWRRLLARLRRRRAAAVTAAELEERARRELVGELATRIRAAAPLVARDGGLWPGAVRPQGGRLHLWDGERWIPLSPPLDEP